MILRHRWAWVAVAVALVATGCAPSPTNGAWHQWAREAVDVEFAAYGAHVVDCAHRIADRESGHWPFADNGSHHGIFQLHDGFWGSIRAVAQRLGRSPSWYDPRINAGAAAIGFEQAGRSFRANWPGTRPGDCP